MATIWMGSANIAESFQQLHRKTSGKLGLNYRNDSLHLSLQRSKLSNLSQTGVPRSGPEHGDRNGPRLSRLRALVRTIGHFNA